jgi:hypothetical protein
MMVAVTIESPARKSEPNRLFRTCRHKSYSSGSPPAMIAAHKGKCCKAAVDL